MVRLRTDRTVLLIAHRPELAGQAERIVRLDRGRLVLPAREAA
jgi:ABC-type multidrug transport system fused ATPase/permease subunit